MTIVLSVVWMLVVAASALFLVYLNDKHARDLRDRAVREVMRDKGIEQRPHESVKQALLRHRRESMMPPPMPSSRSLRSVASARAEARKSNPRFG